MRTMRMEREDIENSLKVLSHIVDDDFIITVDEARKIIRIDGETIEALQAEVKRLKECNDELREAQTYIDHYGDKWLTSAKDVPTSAYNHGYMDGKNEAEAAQPHWVSVDDPPKKDGKYLVCWKDGGGFCYDTAWWTSVGTWSLSHWTGVTATHWMPVEPQK